MKALTPRGLSRHRIEELLSKAEVHRSIGSRVEFFSHRFLDCPYKPNPLIGSAERAEAFTVSLNGFDCVTYIETVLALARASGVADFVKWLRKIRYERGIVRWDRRNHYMTGWIRNNIREGIVRSLSFPAYMLTRDRVLSVVPGLRMRHIHLRCIMKRAISGISTELQTGDLIFFASTRRNLDVFHAGILVHEGGKTVMRHASRSRGLVIEQELREFLESNRMAGVILARPRDRSRKKIAKTRLSSERDDAKSLTT